MVGHKLGEFAPTRKRFIHKYDFSYDKHILKLTSVLGRRKTGSQFSIRLAYVTVFHKTTNDMLKPEKNALFNMLCMYIWSEDDHEINSTVLIPITTSPNSKLVSFGVSASWIRGKARAW